MKHRIVKGRTVVIIASLCAGLLTIAQVVQLSAAGAALAEKPPPAIAAIQQQLAGGARLRSLPGQLVKLLAVEQQSMFNSPHETSGYPSVPAMWDHCAEAAGARADSAQACIFGSDSAASTVVLFGDSHALEWIPALDALGKANHFRLLTYIRYGCNFADLVYTYGSSPVDKGCAIFRSAVVKAINAMSPSPSMVIFDEAPLNVKSLTPNGKPVTEKAFAAGITKTLSLIRDPQAQKVVFLGDPQTTMEPSVCLSTHLSDIQSCSAPTPSSKRDAPSFAQLQAKENASWARAVKRGGGQVAWLGDLLCTATVCPDVADGILVHSLDMHVSDAWALHVASALGDIIGCTGYLAPASFSSPGSVLASLNGGLQGSSERTFCESLAAT